MLFKLESGENNQREIMAELMTTPYTRPHPYLILTEGLSTKHYKIGIEGIRYQNGWDDDTVTEMLGNGATFVFGGSTTFGHGVQGDQVFTAKLNELDPDGRYLNFGIQSYDNIHEFRKLVYLLLKGYRPRRVIFVDGLNDVSGMVEDIRLDYYIDANRNRNYLCGYWKLKDAGWPGAPTMNGMVESFLNSLPIYHFAIKIFGSPPEGISEIQPHDPNQMNWNPCEVYDFPESKAILDAQYGKYFFHIRQFDRMMEALASSYGFEYVTFFQPNGCVDVIASAFRCGDAVVLNRYKRFVDQGRNAIKEGILPMVDISNCLSERSELSGKGYVDQTHYSAAGHRQIARCIYANLKNY